MDKLDFKIRKPRVFTYFLCGTVLLLPMVGGGTGIGSRNNVKASDNSFSEPYQSAVHLIKTTASLATERGLIYIAIHSKESVSQETRQLIESNRKEAKESYRLAIDSYDVNFKAELSQPKYNVTRVLQTLDDLRPSIDQQLSTDYSQRDIKLADDWFNRATEAIESIDLVARFINQKISKIDPTLRRILILQRSALKMREQIGLERAILSSAAEGVELGFSQLAILRDHRVIQSQFADVVDLTARDAINDPALASALSKANIAVLDTYRSVRTAMIDPDQSGYAISATDWFEQATISIDALNELIITIVDHAQNKLLDS